MNYKYFKSSNGIKDLYSLCGIYFLMHNGGIDYIGRSVNIGNRLCSHHVFNRTYHDTIAVYEVPFSERYDMRNIERNFIKQFDPPKNINATARQSAMMTGRKRSK